MGGGATYLPLELGMLTIGVTLPAALLPQQIGVPPVLMAQLWKVPVLTLVNVPGGGVA